VTATPKPWKGTGGHGSERGLPNNTFDRTAGSHSLAAAGQRGRWADQRRPYGQEAQ